jgi:hypothetical protein
MATEIQTWQIADGKLTKVSTSLTDSGRKEREDLEVWIKSNPEILGSDIAIIGEQVRTTSGPLDFLGIDRYGNLVIIELKRDKLARDVLAQAIDYASCVAQYEPEQLSEICMGFTKQALSDFLVEKFPQTSFEEVAINQAQRLLLVGFSIEDSLHRMMEWLSEKYSVGINAIVLHYTKTSGGDELLSRTVALPEELELENTNRKKFVIAMSNEPGTYSDADLEVKLKTYLSKDLYSAGRIRDYFLPILLEHETVTREQMKKYFVSLNAAADERQAGIFLALISSQLGHKWKDYLRQVVHFETPFNLWEKDNFSIPVQYKKLVERVLADLNIH